jgi:hypothetical protein
MALKALGAFTHLVEDRTVFCLNGFSFLPFSLVKVMVSRVIHIGPVTLQTEVISFLYKLQAMDIMAIAAADIFQEHLALHERSIDIDFLQDLPI